MGVLYPSCVGEMANELMHFCLPLVCKGSLHTAFSVCASIVGNAQAQEGLKAQFTLLQLIMKKEGQNREAPYSDLHKCRKDGLSCIVGPASALDSCVIVSHLHCTSGCLTPAAPPLYLLLEPNKCGVC